MKGHVQASHYLKQMFWKISEKANLSQLKSEAPSLGVPDLIEVQVTIVISPFCFTNTHSLIANVLEKNSRTVLDHIPNIQCFQTNVLFPCISYLEAKPGLSDLLLVHVAEAPGIARFKSWLCMHTTPSYVHTVSRL